jgi:beta-barrel assembly-enhancing protease
LNNSIPNAWALPGGKIAIHRGLLVELHSEAELAAVLSHEIVHSAARHGAKAMERSLVLGAGLLGMGQVFNECKYEDLASAAALTGSQLIQFKYSREAELEADLYGIEYMFKAGYDLSASAELQKVFLNFSQDTNWLSGLFATHPPTKERLQRNLHTISKYPKLDGFIGKQEYEAAIAKLKEDQKSYDKLDKGYAFLKQGHFKQALQCAEEGLKDQPNEIHLYCLKAKAQSFLHKDREALDTLEKASKLHPSYFDFYLQKGSVNYRLGHLLDAKNDLKKSFSLLPTAEAAYLLGEIELDLGNETLANEYFQIASQSKDRYGQAARAKLTLRS